MVAKEVYAKRRVRAELLGTDAASIARGLARPKRTTIMVSHRNDQIRAHPVARDQWRLRVVDRDPVEGVESVGVASSKPVDTVTARRVLESYLAGDESWRTMVRWRRGLAGASPTVLIPVTLFVAVAVAMTVMAATGRLERWEWKYLPNLVVGVVLVSALGVYAELFFARLRPRLASAVGRRMGVEVREGEAGWFSRAGLWETADGGVASDAKVALVDFSVIVIGLVIPIALIGVGIVFAALPLMA